MNLPTTVELSVKGRMVNVPSAVVEGRTVVVTGRVLKMARVHDEEWMEASPLDAVDPILNSLGQAGLRADIFTFSQSLLGSAGENLPYHSELYDLAVVPITTFPAWWDSLP